MAAVLFGMTFFAIPMGKTSASWIAASADRVTQTTKTLGSIKWIKISGLNEVAFSTIRKLRTRELEVSLKYRILLGATLLISQCLLPPPRLLAN
jgi:ATP-binding cassette, subfamily C (CFTR/MRP), member 1